MNCLTWNWLFVFLIVIFGIFSFLASILYMEYKETMGDGDEDVFTE